MGYKDSNDQWTEHDANFNALLESLGGQQSETGLKISSSLEKQSQTSRARLHYKKYTRGKDLSRCSEKDLANIFGRKTLKPVKKEEYKKENEKDTNSEPSNFTFGGGSMVDYFKKKNVCHKTGYSVGSNGVLKKDLSSDDEPSFGFGFKTEDGKQKSKSLTNGDITPKKIKSGTFTEDGYSNPGFDPLFNNVVVQKHQLNTIEEEGDCRENDGEQFRKNEKEKFNSFLPSSENSKEEVIENETSFSYKSKKSKKRKSLASDDLTPKKIRNESFDNCGLSNPAFNFLSAEIEEQQNVDGCDVNNIKKRKKKEARALAAELKNGDDNTLNSERFEIPRKNKKVKKKNGSVLDYSISNVCHSDDNVKHISRNITKQATDVFFQEETAEVENEKKKDKKKKKNNLAAGIDNEVTLCDESLNNTNKTFSENFEVKRKKKKQKIVQEMGCDNPTFDTNTNICNSPVNNNFEIKRKKDKYAIDNPNLNISVDENISKTVDESEFDIMLNITTTPSQPKSNVSTSPKNRKQSKFKRKSVRFSDVTEERIIPSNEDIENRNELFDINSKIIESGLSSPDDPNQELQEISRKIDCFQAEIENDINEDKASRYIGEIGDPDGLNEKLPDGTKLKLKFAKFGRIAPLSFKHNESSPKSSYRHLIKGDIVLGFKNTNLHEIEGYAVRATK